MGKFAKIFELENDEQVLLEKGYDQKENKYLVILSTDIDSVRAKVTLGFDNEEETKNNVDVFGLSDAIDFRNDMINMLNNGN